MAALVRSALFLYNLERIGQRFMKLFAFTFALLIAFAVGISAQEISDAARPGGAVKPAPGVSSVEDLAKSVLTAHGGEKLKKMRTLVLKGSVDLNVFNQSMPGAFSTAVSGDKYFFEIVSAMQNLKQVYDGKETRSSIDGFALPPITSMGFPLLTRIGDQGYSITALSEKQKKKGFRITTPEGFYTDFIIDEKTNQVKGYDSAYDVGGRTVTTAVEIKSYELVEGITVPKNYSQRFDLGSMTAYANFKTKTIQVNTPIEDSAFSLK
ncbi:hypothetical protein BH20ACI2_BH20ACI2_13470 [soil metagenome]